MKLSILIVNWNTRDFLEACLSSIYANPLDGSFEVVVVDNASKDSSPQMVKERFPQVRLVENRENVGFARANNQAIAQSSGQYILLLNPDTKVKPGAFEALVEFMDAVLHTGAAGSRLLKPDGALQPSCSPEPTLSRELWHLFHLDRLRAYASYAMDGWDLEIPRSVDVLQGASLLLRREALDQIGLLDEDYFVYSEEVDLCHRLKKAGWELYWVPQSKVIHYEGQSTQQVSGEMFLHLYRGKLHYFRKHHGHLASWVYKFILFAASLTRLILTPLAWFEPPAQRQRHLDLAGNYFRVLMALPGM